MPDAPDLAAPAVELPPGVADGRERLVDPRWIDTRRIGLAIFWGIFCALAMVGSCLTVLLAPWPFVAKAGLLVLWALVAIAAAAHTIRWPVLEYRHLSYRLSEREIRIRRGVWWRTVASVPRSRVQHTDVSQGPVQRGFGLATLVIYTAGTQHAAVLLDGLAHETAVLIRNHLIDSGASDGC